MAKIPFDIKYRNKIESGEYKVETDSKEPVTIIKWDLRNDDGNIFCYYFDGREEIPYVTDGRDLFIVTPEEELTEFEIAIHRRLNLVNGENLSATELLEETKGMAAELLVLARKEFAKEYKGGSEANEKTISAYCSGYEAGKAEALKEFLRWKKCQEKDPNACVYNCVAREYSLLYYDGHTLRLIDLEKLPGFKED